MTLDISSRAFSASPQVRSGIERAIQSAVEHLQGYESELAFQEVVQPFFTRARIIDAMTTTEFPAMRAHFALAPSGEVRALFGAIENLAWLVGTDRPRHLDTLDGAKLYAFNADFWTSDNEWRDFRVASVDEIYWRTYLKEADEQRIAEVRRELAGAITPLETSETPDGVRLKFWLLAKCQLIRRELIVARSGELTRIDDVRASDLPVYEGKLWEMIDGRLVPSG